MSEASLTDIDNAHDFIGDAWNYRCMIVDINQVQSVEELAEQYALLATHLDKTLLEADQAFELVRTELVAASEMDVSAHLTAFREAHKMTSIFHQLRDRNPDEMPAYNIEEIVLHIDWLHENLLKLKSLDRDELIHRMAVEQAKAKQARIDKEVKWSGWKSPKQWAILYGMSSKTFVRHCEQNKIRHEKKDTKNYRIPLSDLPPSYFPQQVDNK